MKILCIHAHPDDYEFVTGGTFELWRRRDYPEFKAKVVVCTDGAAGHHFRSREETATLREEEQARSARIGKYAFEFLRLPDGRVPREGCLEIGRPLLAALWRVIRDFEPDYLFCPPIPADPLAGVHCDHLAVAEAVRRVAYLINVPHAFTPEYPANEAASRPCKVPVILNLYDGYMAGANSFDLAVDIGGSFATVCATSFCHQSQIAEWLPWVNRHKLTRPTSLENWSEALTARFRQRNAELEIPSDHLVETFTVTAWGEVPTLRQLMDDFPAINPRLSHLERLAARLARWRGEDPP